MSYGYISSYGNFRLLVTIGTSFLLCFVFYWHILNCIIRHLFVILLNVAPAVTIANSYCLYTFVFKEKRAKGGGGDLHILSTQCIWKWSFKYTVRNVFTNILTWVLLIQKQNYKHTFFFSIAAPFNWDSDILFDFVFSIP